MQKCCLSCCCFENYNFSSQPFSPTTHNVFHSFIFLLGPRCDKALGMQNGRIRNTQLSASSFYGGLAPRNGRLHFRRSGSRLGAWCALYNTRYQWYQVDFGRCMRVIKIATMGRQDYRQWVTQYYIEYSVDGGNFAEYKENSNRKVRIGKMVAYPWDLSSTHIPVFF